MSDFDFFEYSDRNRHGLPRYRCGIRCKRCGAAALGLTAAGQAWGWEGHHRDECSFLSPIGGQGPGAAPYTAGAAPQTQEATNA